MGHQQADAYREAIEEYRAASRARMAKSSGDDVTRIYKMIPRRQISNYFFQFRKVRYLLVLYKPSNSFSFSTLQCSCSISFSFNL